MFSLHFCRRWFSLLILSCFTLLTTGAELGNAGNSARNGGQWLRLGLSDLSGVPAGTLNAAGVDFKIGDGARSCLLLSRRAGFEPSVVVPVTPPEGGPGSALYLLHAGTGLRGTPGEVVIEYADGTSDKRPVRAGVELSDWKRPGLPGVNAGRGWTAYSGDTQISLYVSAFPLKKAVKSLTFRLNEQQKPGPVWFIAGIAIAPERQLDPLTPEFRIRGSDPAPPPRFAGPSDSAGIPRNIILIIGDGMGFGSLRAASNYAAGEPGRLLMEQLPVHGLVETYSANQQITDSAASGTALACGFKTDNGKVGVSPAGIPLRSITEAALAAGRSVGILTSDSLTGATPAAFSAHVGSRRELAAIAAQQARSGIDVLLGNAASAAAFLHRGEPGSIRTDDDQLLRELAARGYTRVSDLKEFQQAGPGKVFGFPELPMEDPERPAAFLRVMLERLNANPRGFFAMIECHWPDYGGHSNNPDATVAGVLAADFVVQAALNFAAASRDTLVIVTADHETGVVTAARNPADRRETLVYYSSTGHSAAPVPLFAAGPGANCFGGLLRNTDIPRRLERLWIPETARPEATNPAAAVKK